jgi:GNAT superfamily N-acetyltransferase
LDDLEWLLKDLKLFAQSLKRKYLIYGDEEYATRQVSWLITDNLFFVAERSGAPIGFVAGYYTPHFFNPSLKFLFELFFYVKPEHRGSRAGLMLLKKYIEEGKKNAQWISFSKTTQTQMNSRSLERFGFSEYEQTFLLEV